MKSNSVIKRNKLLLPGIGGLPWWLSGKKFRLPMQETWVWSLAREDPLEKEMAIHFSTQFSSVQFISVQSLSQVRLFATPWIAARQASLSITNFRSSLRLTSIESVMPSSHLILCLPLLLLPPIPPSIRVFPMSQLFAWGGQSTVVSALTSFLPKNIQGWSLE